MKHICKILSAILALTLVLTSNLMPAMACTLEGADPNADPNEEIPVIADEYLDEDGNPIVIPCEHVKKYGYCSTAHTFVWLTENGSLRLYVNPYPTVPTGDTDDSTSDGLSAVIGATPDGERIGGSIPSEPEKPVETTPVETAPIENQPVETEPAQRFADVAPGAWYYNAVNTMGLNGILNGYPDGLFHPDDYMTEAEMLTVIYRLATTDEPWKKAKYSDHWAADVIVSLDWTHALTCYTSIGVGNADEYATRGEANTALIALLIEANRLAYNRDTDTWSSNYYTKVHDWTQTDNPIPDWDAIAAGVPEGNTRWTTVHEWYANRILAAYNFGLVNGKDTAGTFDPAGHLTRAEFCQMLYNAGITECLHVTMNISDWGYGG